MKGVDVSFCNGVVDWQTLKDAGEDFKGYIWQFTGKLQIGGKQFDTNILYD